MSFYGKGKDTKVNRDTTDQARAVWAKLVKKSNICFLIGVACNPDDQHIWDSLRDARRRLVYVNPSDGGFDKWLEATGRKYASHWQMGFEEAIPEIIADSM
jgi:hypothetical protein